MSLINPPDPAAVNGWVALLTPFAMALLIVIQGIQMRLSAVRSQESKQQTAAVAKVLVDSAASSEKKLDEIHGAVNGTYGVSLNIGATALEKVATLTGHPADYKEAAAARSMSDTHEAEQQKLLSAIKDQPNVASLQKSATAIEQK